MCCDDPQGAADLAPGHSIGPDQLGHASDAAQADLGLAVAEHVDMSRLVVVGEDDHAQALGAQHGDHVVE